ncbi:MAG: hypothetical protein JWR21_4347 [Herminiimonas sp.]|nr:hypothetical protein [Herminiimonas sp.]
MHAFSVLKTACYEALSDGDMAMYSSVVDPSSVLEMIHALESFPTAEKVKAISGLLDELTDYIKRSASRDKERAELILRARQVRGDVGL